MEINADGNGSKSVGKLHKREERIAAVLFLTTREGVGGLGFRQEHRQYIQKQTGRMQTQCRWIPRKKWQGPGGGDNV